MSLQEYLDQIAFASGTENTHMTNAEFIKNIADQISVAHTDNGVDSDTFGAMGWGEISTGGYQPHVYALINIGEVVLSSGRRLVNKLSN